ncbi:MAG: hypothetical protein ABFR63_01645 [Thermodesulfobacteriota bacterium]
MEEYSQLQKKQDQTFILICINFALFMVLFIGLGYVTYQSVSLVNRLKGDLDRAELAVTELQDRFHNMDTDVVVERLVATASGELEKTIKNAVQGSNLMEPLERASERMAATHETIEHTGEAIQGIHETVKGLDNEEIAKRVSYHILKGLGEGFNKAAESRKPEGVTGGDSSGSQ